jgi:hypothetical protein
MFGQPLYAYQLMFCIIFVMNKRAKKRMKEAIQKEIAGRSDNRKEQGHSSPTKKAPESRGFTVRPDKKRG